MSTEKNNKPQMMRLNVNIPADEYHKLQALAQARGRTLSDFVRAALMLGEIAYDEAKQGHNIGVVTKDGDVLRMYVVK